MKYYQSQHQKICDNSFFTISSTNTYNSKLDLYSHDAHHDHYINPQFKKNLISLFTDIFPYFKINSAVTLVLIIQLLVYIILPQKYLTIRPYYRLSFEFSSIVAWLLNPFICRSLTSMWVHAIFMMNIGCEFEQKLYHYEKLDNQFSQSSHRLMRCLKGKNFLWIYITVCSLSNILAILTILAPSKAISSNLPSYCLFPYLQYLDHQIHKKVREQTDSDTNPDWKVEKDQLILLKAYKVIIVSYFVYVSQFDDKYHHFQAYLCGIMMLAMQEPVCRVNRAIATRTL